MVSHLATLKNSPFPLSSGFFAYVFIVVYFYAALYFVAVATIAAFVGQHVVRRIIRILGRASIIIFILSFTIFVSAVSLGICHYNMQFYVFSFLFDEIGSLFSFVFSFFNFYFFNIFFCFFLSNQVELV